ncbi:MAG TPA: hypothetical protein VG365_15445 [Solirubrobacteraceae bacterium]|jgi:hypothetical protein|nr:hypothetical protein [Solirubrobacteraceae bacterium]
MTQIRIPVALVPVALTAVATAAVVVQLPELRRYLKIRSMG